MTLRPPDWTSDDGSVRLYCDDCMNILPHLEGVDAVVTDPPFGIDYMSGQGSDVWGDGSIDGDADTSVRDFVIEHAVQNGHSVLCFGSWKIERPKGTRALLIWDTLGALGMGDLRIPWKPSHQEIYVLGNPHGFCGHRGSDVIQFPPVQSMAKNGRVHPMEKPVGLLVQLIAKVRGSTILDPFMGSGTTGVACIKTNRKFIGIEKEPKYFEIAKRRCKEAFAESGLYTGAMA